MVKNLKIFLYFSVYLSLSIIPLHDIVSSNGVLGYRHDWSIPPYADQLKNRLLEGVYVWNDISSASAVYNTVLYYRISEYLISIIVGLNGEILSKAIIVVFMLLSALTMFYLGRTLKFSDKSAFFMGLFYMLSPVLYNRIIAGYHLYNFAYAISPLFFAFLHKYIYHKQKFSYILIAALVFGISAVQIQFPLMLAFMTTLYLLIFIISKKTLDSVVISLRAIAILVVLFIALNSFWILSMLLNPESEVVISEAAPITYHEITNAPKLFPAFLMIGYNHVYDPFYLYTHNRLPSLAIYSLFSLLILSLVASISAINKRKQAYLVLYSLSLLSIGLFFVSAVNGPIPLLWRLLYTKIPLLSAFREVYHSMFMVAFAYTLLIGILVESLPKKVLFSKSKKLLVLVALSAIILVSGYPSLNSFMHQLNVLKHETNDVEVYNFLKDDSQIYRVVYVPSLSPIKYPTVSWRSLDLMIKYSPKPTFSQHVRRISPLEAILQYYVLTSIKEPEKIGSVHKLLEKIAVKYIICRSNLISYYPYYVPMLKYLNEVYGDSSLYINWFNTSSRCEFIKRGEKQIKFDGRYIVRLNNSPFMNVGEPKIMSSSYSGLLSIAQHLDDNEFVVTFSPQLKSLPSDVSSVFVLSENSSYMLYLINPNSTLFVAPSASNNRPERDWAFDTLSWYIHPSIAISPVYGGNTILTWAPPKADLKKNLPISNLIVSWDFVSVDQVEEWKGNTPESQFNAVQTISWDKTKGSLKVELYNSTWGWKTIRSPLIPAKYGHIYRFVFKIKGENTHTVHAYIKEYDVSKMLIRDSFLYYPSIGDGTFNWKKVIIDYGPKTESTRYIQLQIWHGHKTDKPLPNIIWLDDVKVYDITKYCRPVTLEIPFKVNKPDNYKLFIRYFKNQRGGAIKVYLGDGSITINTRDQLNKFVWKDLGTFHLGKGEHKIILENVRGFNAVNLFALIPEDEYNKTKEKVEKLLQRKTIIYIFEGESDLYREGADIMKEFNASNGEVLEFKSKGKAWQSVEVIKNGTYRIALKGFGKFKVSIGNCSYVMSLNNSTFVYTTEFKLMHGKYNLTITPIFDNLVRNPSFENEAKFWNEGFKKFVVRLNDTTSYDGKHSLMVTTNSTKKGTWSWIRSEPIDVKPEKEYLVVTHMKYYNVKASHIKLEAYYPVEDKWKQLTPFIPGGGIGDSDWQEYSNIMKIPENVTKIRVVLNAGWVLNESKGEAITWFDDIEVIPFEEAPKLDVIWLYSTETNQTINQLFQVNETPANVTSYAKINPTLWKVKVNAKKPFMLSFAESYDPLWEARIYKNGKIVKKIKPVPLYGVINGFWINETGNLSIEIRYTPQDWFEIGLWISGATFMGCVGYIFYDWMKDRKLKGRNARKKGCGKEKRKR